MATAPTNRQAEPQRGRQLLLLLLTALVTLSLVLRLRPVPAQPGDPLLLLQGGEGPQPALLSGSLLEDPRLAPQAAAPAAAPNAAPTGAATGAATGTAGPCKLLLQTARGRSELAFRHCPPLQQGWRVRVSGSLRRLQPAPHPLLAGPAERLAAQGVHTRLQVDQLEVLERPPTPILDLRRRIAGRLIEASGAERGGLLAALVLGSAVVPLPAAVRDSFRVAGLSHALAASGFHLTVLLGVVTALGRPLGRGLRLALAAAAILSFLLLAGPQGSVVRAVLMGAVALLALEFGRRARPIPLLLTTVVVMLWIQPAWLQDVGFQLSVVATAGLMVTATPLEQAIATRLPARRDGQPGPWRSTLAPALAVPLAASLWTLPLQLLHFGVVPVYAVPANLVAAPLLTPLTLAAMALALVALLLPPLLPPLVLVINPLASLLLAIAQWFAALPMAQWQTGRPLPLLVAGFSLALLGLLLPQLARPLRWLAWLLLPLVLLLHLQLLQADQLLLVHQGGAAGGRDLLLARHGGRGALISSRSDPISCRQARQLATGLGIGRYDWMLLLDPLAATEPDCWRQQANLVLAYGDGSQPLAAGERLSSPGLMVQALTMDSRAMRLQAGQQQWLLLPDRQSLWSWRQLLRRPPAGVWLGFRPRPAERRALQGGGAAVGVRWRWWSGRPEARARPTAWLASGDSGSLQALGS
ncbi:MAG: ComEC/Rec2 family competence protein [Synechococcus sp.]|nr:ComEC/Rec2 family competence protein [Synechococcus sp.]